LNQFEDLEAWKLAREVCREIYRVSGQGQFARDFALRDQIRRAAISISSNIAEGFERDGSSEFAHILWVANGSACEVRSQLHLALDQDYLTPELHGRLVVLTTRCSSVLGGLIRYLRGSGLAGTKRRGSATRDARPETRDEPTAN
jgi:four helix bundle protein